MKERMNAFIELQIGLFKSLTTKYPEIAKLNLSEPYLWGIQKTGTIDYCGNLWGYQFHGKGIRFIRISNLIIVDIHDNLENLNEIDRYRFETYLESIGLDENEIEAEVRFLPS